MGSPCSCCFPWQWLWPHHCWNWRLISYLLSSVSRHEQGKEVNPIGLTTKACPVEQTNSSIPSAYILQLQENKNATDNRVASWTGGVWTTSLRHSAMLVADQILQLAEAASWPQWPPSQSINQVAVALLSKSMETTRSAAAAAVSPTLLIIAPRAPHNYTHVKTKSWLRRQ